MNLIAVLQARTGSTRFPGKVLKELNGRAMLEFMLQRVRGIKVDEIVVATTTKPEDDAVVEIAKAADVPFVRGPEDDVLARFALALKEFPSDDVMRLTGDCPLIDPTVANMVAADHRKSGATYTSNTLVRTFPVGLDVEIFNASALQQANTEAADPIEREHVTPFIYRRPGRFPLAASRQEKLLGRESWVVDTPDDLERVRSMVASLKDPLRANMNDILKVVGRSATTSVIDPVRERDLQTLRILGVSPDFQPIDSEVDRTASEALLRQSLADPSTRAWVAHSSSGVFGWIGIRTTDGLGHLFGGFSEAGVHLWPGALEAVLEALDFDRQVWRLCCNPATIFEQGLAFNDFSPAEEIGQFEITRS